MASLYTIPPTTADVVKKLRFASARANNPESQIFEIDRTSHAIVPQAPGDKFQTIDDLADALPPNSPRYILLSYPMTRADGRKSSPFVMLYYLPETATQQAKMLYAGAVEIFRSAAGVSQLIEIEEDEDLQTIADQIR
ncbi:actin depolymerizing protein [Dipodascopsis tothii]|uniref:actin depolymerizing protein n=1 Tax=Dipodascopsis tothii TaxID=44089 RepID=UPI0034CF092A